MQRPVLPGELPRTPLARPLFDDCTEAHNELHRRRGYSPFQLLIGRSPPGLPLDGDKQVGEVSASLTSDGTTSIAHSKRVLSGLSGRRDEHSTEATRDAQIKTLPSMVIGRMVLVLAFESASASTDQGQSTVQGRCFLGSSTCTSAGTGAEGKRHQMQSCGVDRGWRPAGALFLSSSSPGVYGRTNVVLAEEMEKLEPFNKWCENSRNGISLILSDSPHQSRKISKEPMDVTYSDEELPEYLWFSDEEVASAPEFAPTETDDSEVRKDPQVTGQTKAAPTRAEKPVAETTEPAAVPPTTRVDQSPSTARPSTARPFAPQPSTVSTIIDVAADNNTSDRSHHRGRMYL